VKIVDEVIQVNEEDSGPVSKEVNQLDGIPVGISAARRFGRHCNWPNARKTRAKPSSPSCRRRPNATFRRGSFADIDTNADDITGLIPAGKTSN